MIGKEIQHYKIVDKLGEGGMGAVYAAEDLKLKRSVALKFLAAHAAAGQEERSRLMNEARAAAALDHPNICPVYEINESTEDDAFPQGGLYIVMALVAGQTLEKLIDAAKTPLPLDRCVTIAIQIAEGLQAAHAKGIVHRDIKPANIMIGESDLVRITDFGLAKLSGSSHLTREGTTLGTTAYMSPEQARGDEVDQRADIWALGVILFEMIVGLKPFRGDYEQAVVYSVLNEDPEPITTLRSGMPMSVERIVAKAMAKNPNHRYQDMRDLLVDLKAVQRDVDGGTSVRRPGRAVDVAQQARKEDADSGRPRGSKRFIAVAAAGIALPALIAVFYFLADSEQVRDINQSIAVLPFVNERGDQNIEYLSDGITETLIGQLSPIASLKVLARSTVFQFKGSTKSPTAVGTELGVTSVLSGRLDLYENTLIVGVELIDVATGAQLWGQRFSREMADIFAIEKEIAQNIADKLSLRLGRTEQQIMTRQATRDDVAYQLYLQGRFHWNKRSYAGFEKALAFFEQAAARDPTYAQAWAGIADCYSIAWGGYLRVPQKEALAKAKEAAGRAVEHDPMLAEAHAALGNVALGEWDWQASEKAFDRAIELNPGYASAHQWLGELYYITGRFDESLAAIGRALEQDPLNLIMNSVLGWSYLAAKEGIKAEAQFQQVVELEPGFLDALDGLFQAKLLVGRPDLELIEAGITRDRILKIVSESRLPDLQAAVSRTGTLEGYWRARLDILLQEGADALWIQQFAFAECYAQLGETKKAVAALEKAYADRAPYLAYLKIFTPLRPLYGDPGFEVLVRKLNLP